jgi:hypothetical protein
VVSGEKINQNKQKTMGLYPSTGKLLKSFKKQKMFYDHAAP